MVAQMKESKRRLSVSDQVVSVSLTKPIFLVISDGGHWHLMGARPLSASCGYGPTAVDLNISAQISCRSVIVFSESGQMLRRH
jgi:hypothetical protein